MSNCIPFRYAPRALSHENRRKHIEAIRKSRRQYERDNMSLTQPQLASANDRELIWTKMANPNFG